MKVLVLGGNGATGSHVIKQLLKNDVNVITIVRNAAKLDSLKNTGNLEIVTASILDMNTTKLSEVLEDVDAVVSCLGHNTTLKGIWGKPHQLVTEALRKTYEAIIIKNKKIKLVLMNTTACLNVDLDEKFPLAEKIVLSTLRIVLPPQRDNELAVNYLKSSIGENDPNIEWIAVRPDTLINEEEV